ncbi:MAG: pro-sigmaK processing inhibitor BofA family protein [Oscillospiraceae bacterium]|nr:pro-sigmaK processing inhibitor BofA family protein [Oscillospiraceae bacterium]
MSTGLKVLLCAAAAAGAIGILLSMLRSRRLLRHLLLTAVSGIAALYAVNALGMLTGIGLSVNALSLSVSAIGGAPGVISLLLLDTLFQLNA